MRPTIVAASRILRTDLKYTITIRLSHRLQDPVALLPEFLCSSISSAPAVTAYPIACVRQEASVECTVFRRGQSLKNGMDQYLSPVGSTLRVHQESLCISTTWLIE